MNQTNYAAWLHSEKKIIHCITNYITANDCANILLAAGASPIMAHHPLEMEEIQSGCHALVCNLGATESYEAMKLAVACASSHKHPIIIDPVGCSGSTFRRNFFYELASKFPPTCIRGNSAEILALAYKSSTVTGVDGLSSLDLENQELQVIAAAKQLSLQYNCFVVASGKTDIVADHEHVVKLHSGDEMMRFVTGTGCMSSCLLGAYLALDCSFDAVISCLDRMGISGEIAAKKAREQHSGSMTFRNLLIDELFLFSRK